ncbi:MAG: hypothetical protein AAGD12_06125 [Pseudomonadota bacterium]
MAKSKTTIRKFYIVDLIRNKGLKHIEIPKTRVDITIEVTTKGIFSASSAPSAAMDRLEKAARDTLNTYEKTITEEAAKLDAKVDFLLTMPTDENVKAAEKMIQATNVSIKNALQSAEGAAMKAVDERLKKEIQGDKNLKEARVRTGVKWTLGVIKIGTSVGRLVGTMGADITAYVTIGKELVTLGLDLRQQLKNEEKLRKDLQKGIQDYITLRGTLIMQAAERQLTDTSGIDIKKPIEAIKTIAGKLKTAGTEVTKNKDPKTVATAVMDFVVKGIKSQISDAEASRKAYREHTTKTRHKTDKVSAKADALQDAMKKAKNLKDGVKIGAQCMAVKRSVKALADKLEEREAFLDEMQQLMAGNGLTIDDRTTLQKIRELDKMTVASSAGEVISAISTVSSALKEVAKLAA